jgi:hypothetical protein
MFERTKSGQENRATFYGVRAVCYVEGPEGRRDSGIDAMFWGKVFSTFKPDMSVKFISRGGKPVLEALARDVIDKDMRNAYVAMDSDYDEYFGEKIDDTRILYTYGYSIENDLFHLDNLNRAYAVLAHVHQTPRNAKARLKSEYARIQQELRLGVYADILALKAKTSVLPRDAPGRVIGCDAATLRPIVKKAEIKKLCGGANQRTKPRANVNLTSRIEVARFCVGHVLRHGLNYVLRATLREFHRKTNFSADHIRDVLLQTFSATLGGRNPIAKHHRDQMAAI